MMLTTMLAATLLAQKKDVKTYRDDKLGFSFDYPKSWALTKARLYNLLEFRTANGVIARVELINTNFTDTAEQWQTLQKDINSTGGKSVSRQWEEELLGVPLLMTQLSEDVKGVNISTVVGLLYSRTPAKLNFRLSAPTAVIDDAQQSWKDALLTIRTNSGSLPKKEDGNGDQAAKPGEEPAKGKTVVLMPPSAEAPKPVTAPNSVDLEAGWRARVPKSWVKGEGGVKTPGLKGAATVTGMTGDSSVVDRAFGLRVASSLGDFKVVSLRRDTGPEYNKAGYTVSTVTRVGTSASGNLTVFQAVGYSGLNSWILEYRSTDKSSAQHDLALLQELVKAMSVEKTS